MRLRERLATTKRNNDRAAHEPERSVEPAKYGVYKILDLVSGPIVSRSQRLLVAVA
jgi:hypothetical protein